MLVNPRPSILTFKSAEKRVKLPMLAVTLATTSLSTRLAARTFCPFIPAISDLVTIEHGPVSLQAMSNAEQGHSPLITAGVPAAGVTSMFESVCSLQWNRALQE